MLAVACALVAGATAADAQGVAQPRRLPLPGAPAAPAAPAAAKFRVTLNGFAVRSQTRDHLVHFDGVGDEVFFKAIVVVIDTSSDAPPIVSTVESRVFGEARRDLANKAVWSNRNPAGTATEKGGLVNGNTFPSREPWNRATAPTTLYLPMEIWCGPLVDGQTAVLITPTVWEWDGPSSVFVSEWLNWSRRLPSLLGENELFKKLTGKTGTAIVEGADLALGLVASLDSAGLVGGEADRPIGVRKSAQPKKYEFAPPHFLVLSYRSAEASSKAHTFGGAAPGVHPLEFEDDGFYQGRYSLFVQIERMDGKQCIGENQPPKE